MKKTITFALDDTDKPKYQRMVERLEAGIGAGQWNPGDRLPSNRELAVKFGVTIGTVSKAMSEAVRRGILETRVGSGTYIRDPRTLPLPLAHGSPRMVDLSLNVLPLTPVRELLDQAMTAHARIHGAAGLFAHVGVQQHGHFRQAAAAWLTGMGTPAEPDEVILTNGVHHGLIAAFLVLLQPGAVALCDALCYTGFQRIAKAHGVRLAGVGGDAEGMRPDILEEALRETGARVLIANPVLQNPTATTMPPQRQAAIAAIARKHDMLVIEDGVAAPLAAPGTTSLAAQMPERTVHLAGFSKSIASGFRLGYARMPRGWIDRFREATVAMQWFPPGYYAELVTVMHSEGLLERCIDAHRAEAAARQQLLQEYLPQVGARVAGYHAWLPLQPERSSVELCDELRAEGVRLSAAHHFAVAADAPDGLRISLGACEDRGELRRGVLALVAALQPRSRYRPEAAAPAV